MDCKKYQNLINEYIEDNLFDDELDLFIKHIDTCEECYEELQINYSVITALKQIDNGEDFSEDYDFELKEKIHSYKYAKKRLKYLLAGALSFCFVISMLLTVLLMILTHKSDINYSNEKTSTSVVFKNEDIPDNFDFVDKTISDYNPQIIKYLHSIKNNK